VSKHGKHGIGLAYRPYRIGGVLEAGARSKHRVIGKHGIDRYVKMHELGVWRSIS